MRFVFCSVLIFSLVGCASTRFVPSTINEIPMYGNATFTENQRNTNDQFIQTVLDSGRTREQGSMDSVRLGFQYLNRGDLSTAIKRFNQGWLLNAGNPEVFSGYGVWYGRQERFDKAIEMFLIGLEKNPSHKSMLHDIGYTYNLLALRHMYVGYEIRTRDTAKLKIAEDLLNKATGYLTKAIERYPDDAAPYMTLAASMQHLRRFDEAISNAQKALELGDREAERYLIYLKSAKVRLSSG